MKINPIGHLVKTNPIQTQSNPIAERVKLMQSLYLQRIMKKNAAKGYEKTKPKQTQFPKSQKMNANAFLQKDYENETTLRPQKNKPKQSQFQRQKNAPAPLRSRCVEQEIFEKLLICTCFYSIIVLFYAIYTERHIYQSVMEKVQNAN